jgi:hypothetical protein
MMGPDERNLREVISTSNSRWIQQARAENTIASIPESIDILKDIANIEIPEAIDKEITDLTVRLYRSKEAVSDAGSIRDRLKSLGINTRYFDALAPSSRPVVKDILNVFKQQYRTNIYKQRETNEQE